MKNICAEDKKFLQGVWGKTRYLEYLKIEEKIVKENERKIKIKNTKITVISILMCIACIAITKIVNFKFIYVELISFVMSALATFYEYREGREIEI
ncbi:hypothetical protein ACFIJ5_14700 [Haloimpatiens sp. FM7330]|uniref:hypothetical protein n=1 Tax=Haloimpatiens sp. FM7330 TaxID=3298610 RepID=UPI00362B97FE